MLIILPDNQKMDEVPSLASTPVLEERLLHMKRAMRKQQETH